jgi:thiol:disulfide interchange protein DsbC
MLKSILLSGILISLLGADSNLSKKELDGIQKDNVMLSNKGISLISGVDRGEFYQLKINATSGIGQQVMSAFVLKKSGDTFFGGGYHKNGEKIMIPISQSVIKDAITFSYGAGIKNLYIFTNPDCPHCRDFEKSLTPDLEKKLEKNYKVNVIVLNERSENSIYILSGNSEKEKRIRFHNIMIGKAKINNLKLTKEQNAAFADKMMKSSKLTNELGVMSTPSVFTEEFKAVGWTNLIEELRK